MAQQQQHGSLCRKALLRWGQYVDRRRQATSALKKTAVAIHWPTLAAAWQAWTAYRQHRHVQQVTTSRHEPCHQSIDVHAINPSAAGTNTTWDWSNDWQWKHWDPLSAAPSTVSAAHA